MSRLPQLAALLIASMTACMTSTGTAPFADVDIEIRTTPQGMLVMNPIPAPIHHFVVGRNRAELINWAPCVGGDRCPTVPARSQVLVPWPASDHEPVETEYVFYWWRAVSDGAGGLKPDSIRGRVVVR